MDNVTFEQLLHAEESNTLDFKQQQYLFVQAAKEHKAELLKDILGFANASRECDAFILIGVREVRGGRSEVVGIDPSQQLQDHELQQFVNSLTNKAVEFRYEAFCYDTKQVGVIRIERQPRPLYLEKDYGHLKANAVYVRRGSSTDIQRPATTDEAIQMALADKALSNKVMLTVGAGLADTADTQKPVLSWIAVLCEMPAAEDLPDYGRKPSTVRLPSGHCVAVPDVAAIGGGGQCNRHFLRELANYWRFINVARKVCLTITNIGAVAAEDVRLELAVPRGGCVEVADLCDAPDVPAARISIFDTPGLRSLRGVRGPSRTGDVDIERTQGESKVTVEFGGIQPGRAVRSEPFYVSVLQTGTYAILGKVFATNLAEPLDVTVSFDVSVERQGMSVSDLEIAAERLTSRVET